MKLVLGIISLLFSLSINAWTIGAKSVISPSTIHATYFLTPKNTATPVRIDAYLGFMTNGLCNSAARYPLGIEKLQTGDYLSIDAFSLKSVVGGGYNCMTIFYYSHLISRETFLIAFDGNNYNFSYPAKSEVMIQ